MSDLILLPKAEAKSLEEHYKRAFKCSVELYILSAYLTEWCPPSKLSTACVTFRMIIGKDYGITRKKACRDVTRWLPREKKSCFLVAQRIGGFHPKAMFWREADGSLHALVGSSNLTRAAFSTNYEANFYHRLKKEQFNEARNWVERISGGCIDADENWLKTYREAPKGGPTNSKGKTASEEFDEALTLPSPADARRLVRQRRKQIQEYQLRKAGLVQLFKQCANGKISSAEFYEKLPLHWGHKWKNRLQGAGWERSGSTGDFKALSQAFLAILQASDTERDDVVVTKIDELHAKKVAARGAFLSEMLCLAFPSLYPVKNDPIRKFMKAIDFRVTRGASEGASYLSLARLLRAAVQADRRGPAKNLAELDALLWRTYGKSSGDLYQI